MNINAINVALKILIFCEFRESLLRASNIFMMYPSDFVPLGFPNIDFNVSSLNCNPVDDRPPKR